MLPTSETVLTSYTLLSHRKCLRLRDAELPPSCPIPWGWSTSGTSSVFLSNFAIAFCTSTDPGIVVRCRIPDRAWPSGHPGLTTGIEYCVTLPFSGPSCEEHLTEVGVPDVPRDRAPRMRLNQGICQIVFGDDHTRWILPVSRGWAPSGGKFHVGSSLRLTLASHSAVFLPLPPRSTSRLAVPASRCGFRECCRHNRGSSAG